MRTLRTCSVSVDLDPLRCYYEIHGLGPPPAARALRTVVLRRALPRFAEVFARRGLRATLFVVGADLEEDADGRALLGELAAAGHELGNHSHGHNYAMARLEAAEVRTDVERAHRLIAEVAGRPPVGFRAPGYDLSPRMLDALAALGYSYDSSLFPAPLYWMAKVAVMGWLALRRRPSGAVVGNPRGLVAPLDPYRPALASPWRRGTAPLVELPISVTGGLRIPVIGTSVLLAPEAVRRRLLASMRARPHFNFELHGIDLVDADEDGIPAELVARQPDLRAPLADKRRALEDTLDRLASDFRFAPLREVAAEVQRRGRLDD